MADIGTPVRREVVEPLVAPRRPVRSTPREPARKEESPAAPRRERVPAGPQRERIPAGV